jgi:hypothetical protein
VVESLLELIELVLFGNPKAYYFLKSVRELMTLVPQSAMYRQLEVSLDITSSSSNKVKTFSSVLLFSRVPDLLFRKQGLQIFQVVNKVVNIP